jgi:hypothetical protein
VARHKSVIESRGCKLDIRHKTTREPTWNTYRAHHCLHNSDSHAILVDLRSEIHPRNTSMDRPSDIVVSGRQDGRHDGCVGHVHHHLETVRLLIRDDFHHHHRSDDCRNDRYRIVHHVHLDQDDETGDQAMGRSRLIFKNARNILVTQQR